MKNFLLVLFGVLLGSTALSAQAITVGVKGGVPLNDPTYNSPASSTAVFPNTAKDESAPYIVGGFIELRLPKNLAVEADALYRPIGNTFSYSGGSSGVTVRNRERGNSWEFPVLGKYYFPGKNSWQPFVGAGASLRTIGFTDQVSIVNSSAATVTSNFRPDVQAGATFAAGLRIKKGPIAFIPEFRYTRWGRENYQLVRNDAKFLLGISF